MTIQGKNIGILNCGQLLSAPPTEEGFRELKKRLSGLNIEERKLREAYFRSPHMPPEKLDSLLKLLSFFASYCCEVGMRLKQGQADEKYPEILKAKHFIKGHFREPISLKIVAEHVLLSEAYLSRLFHRIEGITLSRYLQNIRREEAKKLLVQTDYPISQIIFSVGFNNSSYFNELFRKAEACTPSQYRTLEKSLALTPAKNGGLSTWGKPLKSRVHIVNIIDVCISTDPCAGVFYAKVNRVVATYAKLYNAKSSHQNGKPFCHKKTGMITQNIDRLS